jgi:hypothetical protein
MTRHSQGRSAGSGTHTIFLSLLGLPAGGSQLWNALVREPGYRG